LDHPEHPLARNSYSVGHLTASALVIDPEGPRMVLLHHRKLDIWVQPGGHVDLSGDLAADALREATEETGIEGLSVVRPAVDIDVHPIVTPAEPPHDHHDVRFVVLAPGGAELVPNHESKAARWVDMDHFGGLDVDDSVRRLADAGRRWLSGRP